MDRGKVLAILTAFAAKFQMTGSRYICDPAPQDTDEDYIALMDDAGMAALLEAGFDLNTDSMLYGGCPDFWAFRAGDFNVIRVEDPQMYALWVEATEQAKALNLLSKDDRIALFQKVLYADQMVDF